MTARRDRSEVAYELAAKYVVNALDLGHDDVPVHTRFPQVVQIAKDWLDECVTFEPGCDLAMLLPVRRASAPRAAERVFGAIVHARDDDGNRRSECCCPMFQPLRPRGLHRRRRVLHPQGRDRRPRSRRSTTSTLDGSKGNTWEEAIAGDARERIPGARRT